MNQSIHLQIAKDMKIRNFQNENENDFINRVIYSSISEWIKASTFDRKIDNQEGVTENGCTKHHITRKCGDILEGFIEVYPQIESYFFPSDKKEPKPIQDIQKRLLMGGILVSGENNTIQLSQQKYGQISDHLFFERGNFFQIGKQVSGLGCYTNSVPEEISINHIDELFFIPPKTAKETVLSYYKLMEGKFEIISSVPEYWKFFDFLSRKSFHNSWVDQFNKEGKITVYKNINNPLEYGFAKYNNGTLSIAKFPNHIAETKEIRRILYGLRAIENNPCQANLTLKSDSVDLEFYTSLPQREQTLLYMIAWPVRSMYDRTQYTSSIEFLPTIKKMLNNLTVNFTVIDR